VGFYTGGRIEQLVDITEQKCLQKKIEKLAITDELTGIYNRRGLFELGLHDFNRARRTNMLLSIIYIDIDHFKDINDQYGHSKSDMILRELVNRVKANLRDMDTFSRVGGDEFIILLPEANLQQAQEIANRLKAVVSNLPFQIGPLPIPVSLCMGVTQIDQLDTFSNLIDRADSLMYKAKQNGRNRIES
jgi:diguanylate cyclase (GGDEF)-like protein